MFDFHLICEEDLILYNLCQNIVKCLKLSRSRLSHCLLFLEHEFLQRGLLSLEDGNRRIGLLDFNQPCSNQFCFVPGGPGSGKGTIINNLVEMFDFHLICGEDLILHNLTKKLLPSTSDCSMKSVNMCTRELAKLLQANQTELTLEWVLKLVKEEIDRYPGRPVLVDIVPNIKFLLKVESFIKECTEEMKEFEERVS